MAIVARLPEVTVDTARYTLHLADLAKRTNTLEKEQLQELQDIDTVMANRMMLFMILSYAMSCHVSEWPFWDEVKNAYMFVRADKLWPDVASRRAIEMWENMQPPEAFSPTWKAMVQKYVHRFAGMGMRLIPLDFGSL
jgi:hypothetical protein